MMNPFDKLAELAAQLSDIYAGVAKQHNLTLNELHFLYAVGRSGVVSPSAIGDKWSLPKQTVTSVCKQLDRKGFLQFESNEQDKRGKQIRLTASGEAFVRPLIDALTQAELQVSAQFGEEKFAALLRHFEQLLQIFSQRLKDIQDSDQAEK
ncbi:MULTISPECIES: MarR family winged helix-turn-helix transcriptional regulator [Pasteurellaceae]|uniref:MarR family winged helix-turn-helix transcriptional regulator n=1 Tax=Pasteurellaceae TaxID=712 RepID=UPI0035668FE5